MTGPAAPSKIAACAPSTAPDRTERGRTPSAHAGITVEGAAIEFLREIRKDPALSALTVVVLTTSNEDRDRVDAFQLHVAGYLLKPVTFSEFAEVMATLDKYWTLMELP